MASPDRDPQDATLDDLTPPTTVALTLTKVLSLDLEALAAQTQTTVTALYRELLSGALGTTEFVTAVVDVIVGANAQAVSMSQGSWDTLLTFLGVPLEEVPHESMDHVLDFERVTQAVETVLDDIDYDDIEDEPEEEPDDFEDADAEFDDAMALLEDEPEERPATVTKAENRLLRIAQAEPKEAGQRRYSENVAGHSKTEGWVREMDSDPCQLCQWWSRDGRVWPKRHSLQTHKGCACLARPVFVSGRIEGVSDAAYRASEARKRYGGDDIRRLVDPAAYTTHKSRAKN